MSHIDELIERHGPDGVRFERLADVTTGPSTIKWDLVQPGERIRYVDLSSVDRQNRRIASTGTVDAVR